MIAQTSQIIPAKIIKLVDDFRRYSKPKQWRFWDMAWQNMRNFRVHISPGSAETLVRKDEITNQHSIAYSLNCISAKNYHNRLICVQVIVCYIYVVFETQCNCTNYDELDCTLKSFVDYNFFHMGYFVVASFLHTSASHGPSAIVECFVYKVIKI